MWALEQWVYYSEKLILGKQGGSSSVCLWGERLLAVLTRAKTVSSICTRLRVPPLARWTVRERVRTSRYFCM
ncbi:hypothetical protein SAMN05443529_11030 [Desulfosporosinus hippei DSM 8344]|uniref:Uncharacterized protein n=1 Tax=Desulfosporosinus hippei DSM 8344 TaxID=1121419 RepID=A0A1G7ZWL3_9FIRM|nr:hypothetical protein SAMN05443529_11030 [Desulfosporosinus hippei DSM 8344]